MNYVWATSELFQISALLHYKYFKDLFNDTTINQNKKYDILNSKERSNTTAFLDLVELQYEYVTWQSLRDNVHSHLCHAKRPMAVSFLTPTPLLKTASMKWENFTTF